MVAPIDVERYRKANMDVKNFFIEKPLNWPLQHLP
jgi:hypothetical protein